MDSTTHTGGSQGEVVYKGVSDWALLAVGTSGQVLKTNGVGANPEWTNAAGGGDVTAAANMDNNALVRGDGGAKGVQHSGILIDDSDNITAVVAITATGLYTVTVAGNTIAAQNTTDGVSNQVGLFSGGNRATPANNDEAYFTFRLDDDLGAQTEFVRFTWKALDVTNTSKDSRPEFQYYTANTLHELVFPAITADDTVVALALAQTLTNKTLTTPVLTLQQGTSPTPTVEGDIQWETDRDLIVIGDGAGQKFFFPVVDATSDPAAVGGAAADGTEDTAARKDHVHQGATTSHAATHPTGGADEVDGDKLDIDWNPTNYNPTTSPSEANSVDNLTAHLAAIDNNLEHSKSITIEDPTSSEDISFFFTNRAITIKEMRAVLIGSSTPSVTWTIRHHATDRNNAGNEVVTTGIVTTSTTGGTDVDNFTTELVTNGAFGTDSDWTKGSGWTIASNVAHSDGTQGGDADLTQTISIKEGVPYEVIFTVTNISAGNVTPVVGETEGTDRSTNATFTETVRAGSGGDLDIRADLNLVADIDDVSVKIPNDVTIPANSFVWLETTAKSGTVTELSVSIFFTVD